ncbi:MAG: substrate-binding domain-containing protein [Spirochaetaceae bacterium]|nr:substrate-binding domain-containing protein [Spirochaetaceae bacterium]
MTQRNSNQSNLVIAVLISSMSGGYQELLWKGIYQKALEKGISLIFFAGKPLNSPYLDDRYHNSLYSCVPLDRVDGIIIAAGTLDNYILPDEFRHFISNYVNVPTVTIGHKLPGIPSVSFSTNILMKEMVDHLIVKHRLKNFAFVKGPEQNTEAQERYGFFCDALEKRGIEVNSDLVVQGSFDSVSGEDAIKILLDQRQVSFDAVICANDEMAFGAYTELNNRGIKIPEDVVITGFDGIEDPAFEYNNISLTTVKQPIYQMGQEALMVIVDYILGESKENNISLSGEILYRFSCGCSKKTSQDFSCIEQLKNESLRRADLQQLLWHLKNITSELSGIEDFNSFKTTLHSTFQSLGLNSYYLSLFQPKVEYHFGRPFDIPNFSKLIIAHNNGGVSLDDEIIFASKGLLPQDFFETKDPFRLLVQPLFSKTEQFGLLIHSLEINDETLSGPLREQISSVIKTIVLNSERKAAELKLHETLQLLRQSEENYRQMAFLLPTLLYETDLEFNFLFMNQATLDILGLSQENTETKSMIYYIA